MTVAALIAVIVDAGVWGVVRMPRPRSAPMAVAGLALWRITGWQRTATGAVAVGDSVSRRGGNVERGLLVRRAAEHLLHGERPALAEPHVYSVELRAQHVLHAALLRVGQAERGAAVGGAD